MPNSATAKNNAKSVSASAQERPSIRTTPAPSRKNANPTIPEHGNTPCRRAVRRESAVRALCVPGPVLPGGGERAARPMPAIRAPRPDRRASAKAATPQPRITAHASHKVARECPQLDGEEGAQQRAGTAPNVFIRVKDAVVAGEFSSSGGGDGPGGRRAGFRPSGMSPCPAPAPPAAIARAWPRRTLTPIARPRPGKPCRARSVNHGLAAARQRHAKFQPGVEGQRVGCPSTRRPNSTLAQARPPIENRQHRGEAAVGCAEHQAETRGTRLPGTPAPKVPTETAGRQRVQRRASCATQLLTLDAA